MITEIQYSISTGSILLLVYESRAYQYHPHSDTIAPSPLFFQHNGTAYLFADRSLGLSLSGQTHLYLS